jgi:hypothetical protein
MFINSNTYKAEVIELIQTSDFIRIAVAFWGKGADELLASTSNKQFRIICNLTSGGTNPEPIRNLTSQKNIEIRHLSALHAKVILGKSIAVVGSANFSTDGLNHESDEDGGWMEAGLKTSDYEQLILIGDWFEELWNRSKNVNEDDLGHAEEQWKLRRRNRSNISNQHGLLSQPQVNLKDRPAYLVVHQDHASKEANDAFAEVIKTEKSKTIGKDTIKGLDFFEDAENYPEDASLVSVHIGRRGGIKVYGTYKRIPQLDKKYTNADGKKKLLQIVVKEKNVLEYPFDGDTRKQVVDYVCTHREWLIELAEKYNWVIPLSEAFGNDG